MGKQIDIIIDDKKITIDSDTPNFDEFVSFVVENSFDVGKIKVSCGEETFDAKAFEECLKDVVSSLLENIRVEKSSLNILLKQIKETRDAH